MDTNTKNSHNHTKDVFMAGLAGIIAGVAGITALALADKDIRKKVGKRAKDLTSSLQDWSTDKLHMIDQHKSELRDSAEKVIDEAKADVPLKQAAMKN